MQLCNPRDQTARYINRALGEGSWAACICRMRQYDITLHTFRNVLRPARIDPPIHVLYLRSGGAKILIFISLTASLRTSLSSRSPKPGHELARGHHCEPCPKDPSVLGRLIPLVSVDPPDMTMLPNRAFRRSISVRLMASTTI